MAKKYTFYATLFTRDLKVTLTCDELQYKEELKFNEHDEWKCIVPRRGMIFDVHLLCESAIDEQDVDAWELSIYLLKSVMITIDTPEPETSQIVYLTIHDEEEADCIAREYEWHCVHCGYMNIFYEWTEEAHCCSCGRKNRIQEPKHAIS